MVKRMFFFLSFLDLLFISCDLLLLYFVYDICIFVVKMVDVYWVLDGWNGEWKVKGSKRMVVFFCLNFFVVLS